MVKISLKYWLDWFLLPTLLYLALSLSVGRHMAKGVYFFFTKQENEEVLPKIFDVFEEKKLQDLD